jgi:N-acetyl-anhydromuramyl-L-alanine amidase AmpD
MKKVLFAVFLLLMLVTARGAQPDYTNAIWRQAYPGHWYTSGNTRSFHVVHDMEGYYWGTISYFQQSGTQASVYYCVNGLKDNASDSPAGEITQMVEEKNYAWHVSCWNRYMFGTEHEGFVSNPAWYTEAQYQASALLTRYICDKYNIPKDRNHIIAHGEWQNAAWKAWMATNFPQIDTTCNNHTDPGVNWNWTHYMQLVIGTPVITTQPTNQTVLMGANATFVAVVGNNPLAYQWRFNGSNIPGATNSSLTLTNVQFSDAGTYSLTTSNTVGSVTSSNATLTVNVLLGFSNITAVPRFTTAIITWNTTTNATTQVEYGPTPSLGMLTPVDARALTNHGALLNGLSAGNTYYYRVVSTLGTNVVKSGTNSFYTDPSLIVQAPQVEFSGVWTIDTASQDKFSPYYQYTASSPVEDSATAIFRPAIVAPGRYDVYVWYPEGTNRSSAVPVEISGATADVLSHIDQTRNGGSWQLLASAMDFAAGTGGFVQISNGTGENNKLVMADAARWVYLPGQDKPVDGTVPSWWSGFYFGTNVDASADADGDGYPANAEYLMGTVPTDPASHFNFRIGRAGAGLQATFSPWLSDRIYELQSSTNLAGNTWTTIANLPVNVNGNGEGVINYTNTATRAFYRLSVRFAP